MSTAYEIAEMLMHELTGAELDVVSGGIFDFLNTVTQVNVVGVQFGAAVLGAVTQVIQQGNNSNI
jgi:hypothetical protein